MACSAVVEVVDPIQEKVGVMVGSGVVDPSKCTYQYLVAQKVDSTIHLLSDQCQIIDYFVVVD